jgi:hypothetical protein
VDVELAVAVVVPADVQGVISPGAAVCTYVPPSSVSVPAAAGAAAPSEAARAVIPMIVRLMRRT